MKLDRDTLWKMIFFQQSDEEIMLENLHRVESENTSLREQIFHFER